MEIEPIKSSLSKALEDNEIIHNGIMDSISDKLNKNLRDLHGTRQQQIVNRLNELGHVFKHPGELADFAKTRLTMHTYEDKPKWREMYLDGTILIASWWDTVDFAYKESDGTVTGTITLGKKPE